MHVRLRPQTFLTCSTAPGAHPALPVQQTKPQESGPCRAVQARRADAVRAESLPRTAKHHQRGCLTGNHKSWLCSAVWCGRGVDYLSRAHSARNTPEHLLARKSGTWIRLWTGQIGLRTPPPHPPTGRAAKRQQQICGQPSQRLECGGYALQSRRGAQMQLELKPSGVQHSASGTSRPCRVARQAHTLLSELNLPPGSNSCGVCNILFSHKNVLHEVDSSDSRRGASDLASLRGTPGPHAARASSTGSPGPAAAAHAAWRPLQNTQCRTCMPAVAVQLSASGVSTPCCLACPARIRTQAQQAELAAPIQLLWRMRQLPRWAKQRMIGAGMPA